MAEDTTTPFDTAPRPAQPGKLYAQPIPIKTYPLPNFYPNNPVSWVYVAYTWLSHVLSPPPPEPAVVHKGVWDPATRSVNVHDLESMQTLWRQGFFGKGNLSRSEATWLRREKAKKGLVQGHVAEFWTAQRREERQSAKWERSRAEQEVIDRQRQAEAERRTARLGTENRLTLDGTSHPESQARGHLSNGEIEKPLHESLLLPPIGPLELLALPNSVAELPKSASMNGGSTTSTLVGSPPSSDDASDNTTSLQDLTDEDVIMNGTKSSNTLDERTSSLTGANGHAHPAPLKRRKSVRFSPTVESTTFLHSDPPSPNHSASSLVKPTPVDEPPLPPSRINGSVLSKDEQTRVDVSGDAAPTSDFEAEILNKEHLQLAPVEAFWLVYALGALSVVDSETKKPYKTAELFTLLRQYSYFPPRTPGEVLSPDDPFMLDLVCYCHLRAIGWVPQPGMKFGVDWLAYKRGVVFEHAEFGMIIMPAYTDPWWKEHPPRASRRTWSWLHGVGRVLSHVYKYLILVYIEVPPPHAIEAQENSITGILQQYSVREVMVKRWSVNRNRG